MDFTKDFRISTKISGFRERFQISREISGKVYEISGSGGPLGFSYVKEAKGQVWIVKNDLEEESQWTLYRSFFFSAVGMYHLLHKVAISNYVLLCCKACVQYRDNPCP